MAYFVGIDIGGTSTDAVLLDDSGTARPLKTPTTPQARGGVENFGRGSTVATNAPIERMIREAAERVDYKGAVVTPLDEDDARAETRDTSRQEHGADGY